MNLAGIKEPSIKVAVVETSVFGVKAYNARCLNCGWETRRYDREVTALKHAKAHRCHESPS